jgi:hypothetical protein
MNASVTGMEETKAAMIKKSAIEIEVMKAKNDEGVTRAIDTHRVNTVTPHRDIAIIKRKVVVIVEMNKGLITKWQTSHVVTSKHQLSQPGLLQEIDLLP